MNLSASKTKLNENLCPVYYSFLFFAAVLFLFFCFFERLGFNNDEKETVAGVIVALTLALSFFVMVIRHRRHTLNAEFLILLLILCGFAMRLAYVLKYPYYINQHDVEGLTNNGHLSYIYGIATGKGLPVTNDWQFSHPPLHHSISALSVKLSWFLGFDNNAAFENIQYLTCFYSSALMPAGYLIFKECNIKKNALLIITALICFHPSLYILAGSINNDVAALLFTVLSLLYLIKWYKTPRIKYAAVSGLFAGLGMMTKFSAALIVAVSAITVTVKLIKDKQLKFSLTIIHTICYTVLVLPLGFWYQFRNYILFHQPLGYVAPMSTESDLYTGGISIIKRLILPFSCTKTGIYTDVWSEYNVWQYLLRNSLFGEYSFGNKGIALALVLINLVLIILFVVICVYFIFKKVRTHTGLLPVLLSFLIQIISFIIFNISYPFGCTMDFRYIVPVLFSSLAITGIFLSEPQSGRLCSAVSFIYRYTAVIFCFLSVILFI